MTAQKRFHFPVEMQRGASPIDRAYVGRGWKARFRCPKCDRAVWQHLNFLGSRLLVCYGNAIKKHTPAFAARRITVKGA
jgi:hypothetical protein